MNFEELIWPEETKEEEAQKLDLKPLHEELKYAYLEDQQTYPVVIYSQLTSDQEGKQLAALNWNTRYTTQKREVNWVFKKP